MRKHCSEGFEGSVKRRENFYVRLDSSLDDSSRTCVAVRDPSVSLNSCSERRYSTHEVTQATASLIPPTTLAGRAWLFVLGTAACSELLAFLFESENENFRGMFHNGGGWRDGVFEGVGLVLIVINLIYVLDAFVAAYQMRTKTIVENHQYDQYFFWRSSPSFAYAAVLLFYLSTLPIGIYICIWNSLGFSRITGWQHAKHDAASNVETFRSLIQTPDYSQFSLMYAFIYHYGRLLLDTIWSIMAENQRRRIRWIQRKLLSFAVRHPLVFRRRNRKFWIAIDWIKYLAPINGNVMNTDLFWHLRNIARKMRQRGDARCCHVRRRSQWVKLDDTARKELAAVILQRNYRSYQSRKWVRMIHAERQTRDEEVIRLVQVAIKKRVSKEREDAFVRLQALQEQERRLRRSTRNVLNPSLSVIGGLNTLSRVTSSDILAPLSNASDGGFILSEEDRKRKYEILKEIRKTVRQEKEQLMLLRPDSPFAASWQGAYVICAILETIRLTMKPQLDIISQQQNKTASFGTMALFIFQHFDNVIGVVLCLGVFVSFFTGELDSVTGNIKPKNFFARWIFPGMLMHLVLNPKMAEISLAVQWLIKFVTRAGCFRVFRWGVFFLVPIWNRAVSWFEWRIWMRLVHSENQRRKKRPRLLRVLSSAQRQKHKSKQL